MYLCEGTIVQVLKGGPSLTSQRCKPWWVSSIWEEPTARNSKRLPHKGKGAVWCRLIAVLHIGLDVHGSAATCLLFFLYCFVATEVTTCNDAIHELLKTLTRVKGNDGWWSFLGTQSMIIASMCNSASHHFIVLCQSKWQASGSCHIELCTFPIFPWVEEIQTSVSSHRPVRMFSTSVDSRKGLLMEKPPGVLELSLELVESSSSHLVDVLQAICQIVSGHNSPSRDELYSIVISRDHEQLLLAAKIAVHGLSIASNSNRLSTSANHWALLHPLIEAMESFHQCTCQSAWQRRKECKGLCPSPEKEKRNCWFDCLNDVGRAIANIPKTLANVHRALNMNIVRTSVEVACWSQPQFGLILLQSLQRLQ